MDRQPVILCCIVGRICVGIISVAQLTSSGMEMIPFEQQEVHGVQWASPRARKVS